MTEGGNSPLAGGWVADLQLDHETTETTRSLGSKSNTQILGLTRDTQIKGIGGRNIISHMWAPKAEFRPRLSIMHREKRGKTLAMASSGPLTTPFLSPLKMKKHITAET